MNQTSALRQWIDRRWLRFLQRRLPRSTALTLDRGRLFIFPTRGGLAFLGFLVLLWLLATNYENNLALALCFLLTSVFILAILHTYANLAGVRVAAHHAGTAFAGDNAPFQLRVQRRDRRAREQLQLHWPGALPVTVDLSSASEVDPVLFVPVRQRGWVHPGRLRISTTFPLGLLRCWSWLDLEMHALVYPQPVAAGPLPRGQALADSGQGQWLTGADDFAELARYRAGDNLAHVAWKAYAQGRGLHTKQYASPVDQRLWLDWDYWPGLDREARLSRLTDWVLQAAEGSDAYGLRLPGLEISPDRGARHRERLLRALALFEAAPPSAASPQEGGDD